MSKYIFLTASIYTIGGMQAYVSDKKRYLEKKGWDVYVFFAEYANGCTKYDNLQDNEQNKLWMLSYPPDVFSLPNRNKVLNKICDYVNAGEDYVIVESHNDTYGLWGELLAEKLKAKHFLFILNEQFRGINKYYVDYSDYFLYKLIRGELAVINKNSIEQLFEGTSVNIAQRDYVLVAANNGGVSDYYEEKIEKIELKTFNIGYLGRLNKGYFKPILNDVIQFANDNQLFDILFLVVGTGKDHEIDNISLKAPKNLTILFVGEFMPIPKSLFTKVDVMIAGSGCADISANNGVMTIVPDANSYEAIGIYGYTTNSLLYSEGKTYKYRDLLYEILIEKRFVNKEITTICSTKADDEFDKHFEYLNRSASSNEYYQFKKKKKLKIGIKSKVKIIASNILGIWFISRIYHKIT